LEILFFENYENDYIYRNFLSTAAWDSFWPVANSEDWIVEESWWTGIWAWSLNLWVAVVENSAIIWISLWGGCSVTVVSFFFSTCWAFNFFSDFSQHSGCAAAWDSFRPVANSENWIVEKSWWTGIRAGSLDLWVAVVENGTIIWVSLRGRCSVTFISFFFSASWSFDFLSGGSHFSGAAAWNGFWPVANSEGWIKEESWWTSAWAGTLDVGIAVVENRAIGGVGLGGGGSVAVVSFFIRTGWSFYFLSDFSHLSCAAAWNGFWPVTNSEGWIKEESWWTGAWAGTLDVGIAIVEN